MPLIASPPDSPYTPWPKVLKPERPLRLPVFCAWSVALPPVMVPICASVVLYQSVFVVGLAAADSGLRAPSTAAPRDATVPARRARSAKRRAIVWYRFSGLGSGFADPALSSSVRPPDLFMLPSYSCCVSPQ
jgi:hypothetical protein